VDFVLEVTVMFTIQFTNAGVWVMLKVFVVLVVLKVLVKNVEFAVPSSAAVTTMVTPFGGITDVITMERGKSGPGAAGWTSLPTVVGVVVTVNAASGVLPPLLPQETNTVLTSNADNKPPIINLIYKSVLYSIPLK
jgi:hypothetical protein